MRNWLIRKLGGYSSLLDALDAIKRGDSLMRDEYIHYLGGFENVKVALESLEDKTLEERQPVLTLAIKHLFHTIGPDDVLRKLKSGRLRLRGRLLDEAASKMLREEAKMVQESAFWKAVQTELRYHAQRGLYTQDVNTPSVVAAKLLIYYIDIIEACFKGLLE